MRELLRLVRAESAKLELAIRDSFSWEIFDNLLASPATTNPADAACFATGVPVIGTSGKAFKESYDILVTLAKFVSSVGLSEAVDQMKGTNAAQTRALSTSLDAMHLYLAAQLISPTTFETAPLRQFRVGVPAPTWYGELDAEALEDILSELNRRQPRDRLTLSCTNALPSARPLPGGPFVVINTVELEVTTSSGSMPGGVVFSKKIDRAVPAAVTASQANPMQCIDATAVIHRKPMKYKADAPQFRSGTVDVISLDSFACGGLAVVRDANANGVPVFASRASSWTQELALSRGGATDLQVFHSSAVVEVSLMRQGEQPTSKNTQAGSHFVSFTEDLEDNDSLAIELRDAAGATVGTWTLQVAIESSVETTNSRYESLIARHRTGRKSIPHAADIPLHRLELGSYLSCADSWKPVLACWTSRIPARLAIDWSSNATLGDLVPQIDPRPPISPPAELLRARETVRVLFEQAQRSVAEIEIDSSPIDSAVEEYVSKYLQWLQADPGSASWLDTFAIHAAEWNSQAGRHVATDEPVVVLLSALHPLRLGWHAVAQKYLSEGLQKPCPAAGLLSPSCCPDAGLVYLQDGQSLKPRALFALPCQHPHWAVMANVTYLDKSTVRSSVLQRLSELGLMVEGITGGFTAQQTQDSLNEVTRLLPARSTLRIGIVGDPETSSECGNGVFRWTERLYTEDSDSISGPREVEVFDARDASDPAPEELADLSERTSEHVRWFKLQQSASLPRLDLTIIDQLGMRSPEAASGSTRSAVAPACLFRTRVREDFQNARAILESRVLSGQATGTRLTDLVTEAFGTYEALSTNDGNRTHFRFTPNQDAVGTRLQKSIFLSVTSSQVDPACIVRGTVGQGGYLWDYELPGILGGSETSLGYYLVAQPTSAMSKAVENAALLLASSPPNVPGLLDEVSRRGIPILKRLASGGSQSRGELGLLLATRLLQDSFRQAAAAPRLPVHTGSCIHFVLPVDPYEELFIRLRRSLLSGAPGEQRPDLIVAAIQLQDGDQPVLIKLTPVEVKYRAGGMSAADMKDALEQAHNLGRLLSELWVASAPSELWKVCGAALLAQFLDFGFRIYAADWLHQRPQSEWASAHQRVIQDILGLRARITVNIAGRLLVFGGTAPTAVADLDGDGRQDTVHISTEDARSILEASARLSAVADGAVQQLDFSFPGCARHAPVDVTPSAPPSSFVQAGPSVETATPAANAAGERAHTNSTHHAEASQAPATRSPVASPVTPEIRRQVQDAFGGFIGNEPAVARLSNDLLRALIERPPHLAKNYLFTGMPSTGKTELARRIARALDLPFVKLDGRSVGSRDKLFDLINGELNSAGVAPSQVGQQLGLPVLEYPPLIVFIDEVHLVPRALQEALLTMLEAADRTVVLSDQVAHMHRATFLFATTRASDVDAAFISRCDEIQLREYTEEEVARILRTKLPHDDWTGEVYQALAVIGRCVPRISIQLAGALETAVLVSEQDKPVLSHLEDVRRAREIDEKGLTRMDFEYLGILERAGGPVGEQNLLNLLRTVDKDRVLNEIEPFLVRVEFIRHGPRGRELTPEGREYLLSHRLHGAGRR
ncbi:Holliday junction DNA helicase RuvB C-terminal domain-containing protein [Bradyrhizobium oligotrophicum]|uniref:Holliday junction DNA helicase RuvB C-terminal domain-containing protein n=1 Tax=Bradyrhizobium TaxID=374 RepID=UPI003EB8FB4E